jgi:hypothetical protein
MPYQPPPRQYPPQQAYYQQQYQPYPPQYQYIPQPPPRQRVSNEKIIGIIVVLVLLMVMIPVIAGVLWVYTRPESSWTESGDVGRENPVGMSVAKNSNGDWLITISSGGGQKLADVIIVVTDPNTGASILRGNINALAAANGTYNDNNGDSKITSGDSILLKSGGPVVAGMKVQLLKGESVIGTIRELPA